MADELISRQALIDEINDQRRIGRTSTPKFTLDIGDAIQCIYDAPSVNAVVLPCKVGDTVYFIDTCHTAEDFGKKYINWGKVTKILVDAKAVSIKPNCMGYSFATTWDKVFLTREEAEKALERGVNDGLL